MHLFRREHVVIVRILWISSNQKCRLASQKRRQWWQEHWRVSNCQTWKTSSRISSCRNYLRSEDKQEWLIIDISPSQGYFSQFWGISSWWNLWSLVKGQSSIIVFRWFNLHSRLLLNCSNYRTAIRPLYFNFYYRTIFYYSLCNNTRRLVPNHSQRNCLKLFQSNRDWNIDWNRVGSREKNRWGFLTTSRTSVRWARRLISLL